MFKLIATLMRGRAEDAEQAFVDKNAVPLLRQQIREAARGVEAARRAVAVLMAQAARERGGLARTTAALADIEARGIAAIEIGRDDLAAEAGEMIATLESELEAGQKTLATYEAGVVRLRLSLSEAEERLRRVQRGQRMVAAVEETRRLRGPMADNGDAPLAEAEQTLARLEERQAGDAAADTALRDMTAATKAGDLSGRLADAGCGAPLRPQAEAVLARLRARASVPQSGPCGA